MNARRIRPSLWIALALFGAVCASPAGAHQFWLTPTGYTLGVGQTVAIGAAAGTGFRGERKPWSPAHSVRFVARTSRTIDLARAASPGDFQWARFAPSDEGGAMIGFESTFTPIELPSTAFDAYLEEEGLSVARAARARASRATAGRERYRRCAKVWLSGRDGARATAALGFPVEIVPQGIPGTTASLSVAVLREGRPLSGALVKAWRFSLGAGNAPVDVSARDSVAVTWQGRTDARGLAWVPVRTAGEWLVSVVDMVPSRVQAEADWESTWASLTFEQTR